MTAPLRCDLSLALRMLGRHRGFTFAALAALSLGIAGATALFTLLYTVLLRPLPFEEPEDLALVYQTNPRRGVFMENVSGPNFLDWREQNGVFSDLVALRQVELIRTGGEQPERLVGAQVSERFFEALGRSPMIGRGFHEGEAEADSRLAILSHDYWRRQFGSDREVAGAPLRLEVAASYDRPGAPVETYTVVGVLPRDFRLPGWESVEVWLPLGSELATLHRDSNFLVVLGRLRPEATVPQAREEMEGIAGRLEAVYPETNEGWRVGVVSLEEHVSGSLRTTLPILFGASTLVLLIACANIANLQLTRAGRRRREIAVRLSLGAGRGVLVRQLMVESVVLAVVAGVIGVLLARTGLALMMAHGGEIIPRGEEISLHLPVLLFALVVSLVTGVAFGMAPALRLARTDPAGELRDGPGAERSIFGRGRTMSALVVCEVALAVVLLTSAGLLIQVFSALERVDLGFRSDRVLAVQISLPETRYGEAHQRERFYAEVLRRLQRLPEARSAGLVDALPLSGAGGNVNFAVEGASADTAGDLLDAPLRSVSPGYFETLGIPLRRGRGFTDDDVARSDAIIINEALAERFWPGQDPIDRGVRIGPAYSQRPYRRVVGVVGDVRHSGPVWDAPPTLYIPYLKWPEMNLVVRSEARPEQLFADVRQVVSGLDQNLPAYNLRSLEEMAFDAVAQPRFRALLLGTFSTVALLLAAIGVYAVVAHTAGQRRFEIGVRRALGAESSEIVRMVVGRGMRTVLLGVGVGILGVAAVDPVLGSLVEVDRPPVLPILVSVGLFVVLVALVASWLPARRAAVVDPVETLNV